MAAISSINILFRADLRQFSSEIQNASREMKKYGNNLQNVGNTLSLGLTLPIVAAGAASVKMASDYNESLNKVDVAFKNSSAQVKEFAKESLTSFGIAEGTALDMAATFGDMATSMGLSTQEAAKMSTSLTGLAGDLASFKNIGINEATTALNGVFTGETESLKRLGIVMTEVNLQTFALSKGIKTQVKDMDQASKVNLRYAYIMANTTNAQGDFVRTGGGAANQMRIFQESLKQLGQQFGSVILPAFTKLITSVNGLIKGFGNLSPATKETIVIIAGVAAAIGPLMSGYGKLLTILPSVANAFRIVSAAIAANPIGLTIIAVQALTLAFLSYASSQKKVVAEQSALNSAIAEGNKNAASEVAALDTLYKTATNVKLSINERKKAVDELQSLYPAYFKNIKDEVILNGTASASYKQLREDIFNKARAIAVDNEIQKRANDRVIKETELRNDILETEKAIQKIRNGADVVVLQEASAIEKTAQVTASKTELIAAQYALLKKQRADLSKFNATSLKEDEALLKAKQEFGRNSSKLAANEVDALGSIAIGLDGVGKAQDENAKNLKSFTPGTIAFYENQIDGLQKLQKEQVTSNAEWIKYQGIIETIQSKIDAIKNASLKVAKPQLEDAALVEPPKFALSDLKDQKAYYETLREQFSTTSDEYARFSELINGTQIKINAIEGTEELKTTLDDVQSKVIDFSGDLQSALSSGAAAFIEGFSEAIASGGNFLNSIGSLLLSTIGNMMQQLGKAAIQIGITMLSIKAAFKTPLAAIAAGAALLLAGTLVKAQMQNAGAFANGGVVGGSSPFGDKLFARVNSGEMILNKGQQRNLANMINPAVSASDVAIQLVGQLKLSGSDLLLGIKRAESKQNRTGS